MATVYRCDRCKAEGNEKPGGIEVNHLLGAFERERYTRNLIDTGVNTSPDLCYNCRQMFFTMWKEFLNYKPKASATGS